MVELGHRFCSHLERESRLAHSTNARQRDQTRGRDQIRHLLDLSLPAHERTQLDRQVVRGRLQRPQQTLIHRPGPLQPIQTDRPGQILEPVLANVHKRHAVRSLPPYQTVRRLRHHDLTTVGRIRHPGSPGYRGAEVVIALRLRLAGVHADTTAQCWSLPGFICDPRR